MTDQPTAGTRTARRQRLAEMDARILLNDCIWRGRLDPRASHDLKEFADMFAETTETVVEALMEREL